jgi:hypothetical protein
MVSKWWMARRADVWRDTHQSKIYGESTQSLFWQNVAELNSMQ